MSAVADARFLHWASEGLVWLPERGMGFYPVDEADEPYRNGGAEAYWKKYEGYAVTPMGEAITRTRVDLVLSHCTDVVLDVGIGCGAFIEALHAAGRSAYGFDVNPIATAWLAEHGLWRDPREPGVTVPVLTLWDVLEHLPDPAELLGRVTGWVFCSLPIFRDGEHVVASRHFRPDEHRWYWTRDGLIRWMAELGLECVAHDDRETRLGREDIETFAFRRAG